MIEDAQRILDYLPISRTPAENNYIEHLWGALCALESGAANIRGFAMLPLHLLFLLAVQCRILRVAQEQKDRYSLSITLKNPKDGQEEMLAPTSPFALAYFGESELADLCKIIELQKDGVGRIKKLIRYRNDSLAHASGYTELNPEERLTEYLAVLEELQSKTLPLNDEIATVWLRDRMPDDDLKEFVEIRLLGSYLCPADFENGLLKRHFDIST